MFGIPEILGESAYQPKPVLGNKPRSVNPPGTGIYQVPRYMPQVTWGSMDLQEHYSPYFTCGDTRQLADLADQREYLSSPTDLFCSATYQYSQALTTIKGHNYHLRNSC